MWSSIISILVSLTTMATVLWKGGAWVESVEQRISQHDHMYSVHRDDKILHMPYEDKVKAFVLREEWLAGLLYRDRQLDDIKEAGLRTEAKIEKIYDLIRVK